MTAITADNLTSLSDWADEGTSFVRGEGTVVTLRRIELVIHPQTAFFRFIAFMEKFMLFASAVALIGVILLSVYFALSTLDNLHAIHVMQSQGAVTAANGLNSSR